MPSFSYTAIFTNFIKNELRYLRAVSSAEMIKAWKFYVFVLFFSLDHCAYATEFGTAEYWTQTLVFSLPPPSPRRERLRNSLLAACASTSRPVLLILITVTSPIPRPRPLARHKSTSDNITCDRARLTGRPFGRIMTRCIYGRSAA